MKSTILYLLTACLLLCATACDKSGEPTVKINPAEPILLTAKQIEAKEHGNNFSFTMFKNVSEEFGENTFFSPLSLNMALGMLRNGTAGETLSEMNSVLGMVNFTETEINEYYKKLSDALLAIDPTTEIGIANSIWYRNGFSVKNSFLDINRQYFDAVARGLNFNNAASADIINSWCADKTKNKIKTIVDLPPPSSAVMYLINAVYFKGQWKFRFDKAMTKTGDFTKESGSVKRVAMMEQKQVLSYYEDQHLECVEMPYGNGAFSMVAILPAAGTKIDQLVSYLDNGKLEEISGKMHPANLRLRLPRFKIECDMELNEPVKDAGMRRIFSPHNGEFANLSGSDELCVSKIKQKTFVEVNEKGTEAVAVTSIEVICTSVGPGNELQFNADRPFLYIIKENSTGTILFIGRMDEPKE